MIKLKVSINYKGQNLQAGKLIKLPEKLEKILVRNNKAEYFKEVKEKKTQNTNIKSNRKS